MRIVLSTATWYSGDQERVGAFEREVTSICVGHDVVIVPQGADVAAAVRGAEVFFPLSGHSFTPEVLEAGTQLKWVHLASAGVDHALYPVLFRRNITLTNAAGVYAIPIAEHVLGMMLALSRRIPEMVRQQDRSEWTGLGGGELHGTTAVVVGVGGIGERVASLLQALGVRVVGVRLHPEKASQHVDEMRSPEELPRVLGEADWVILCAPLTDGTRHLIGIRELALMKPLARIINIARGGLIDEVALVNALQNGQLAGAGLDVFTEEPLPQHNPLWGMPQVIISPHSAGSSPNSLARTLDLFVDNLRRYLAGEPLRNVVDKQAGY